MFNKTQYVIEEKLPSIVRETYSVKDVNRNLLGYVKKERLRLWSKFWFEGTDGTRLGEIHTSKSGHKVYDVQNRLRGIVKQTTFSPSQKKRLLIGIILFVAGVLVAIFSVLLYLMTPIIDMLVTVFIGVALTAFGIYFLSAGHQKQECWIEDPDSRRLAEIKWVGKFFAEYQILAPDGGVIAHIRKRRGLSALRNSFSIDVTCKDLDPLFIISFTVLTADLHRQMRRASLF